MGEGSSGGLGARVAGFTVLALLALFGLSYLGLYLYAGDTMPRSARVEGINVAGLSPAAAEDKLRDGLSERAKEPIEVTFGDGRGAAVDPAAAGLSVDYPASVEEAAGGARLSLRRMWEVITGGGNHRAEIQVDQDAMQAALDRLSAALGQQPVEGSVVFRDGAAVPVRSRPGLVVNGGATETILERRFLHGGSQKLPTEVRQPYITDDDVAEAMESFGKPAMSAPVTLLLGGQKVVAPPRLFGKGLSMIPSNGKLVPRVDGEAMVAALQPAMKTIGKEPVDARFVIRRGRPVLIPAKVGVEFDPGQLETGFADAAVQQGAQRRLAVDGRLSQPSFTTTQAKALKITRQVSTFTTNFPYAEYRNVNLPRAAELINGTVLRPGETFSLNKTVGERTKANGFTEGYVVSDGIFAKDLGGGVSQIATTTFNAMFFAGLKDVQHKPHSVFIDRYPVGREATVAWPSVDLRFTNDTPYGVLIEASVRKSTPSREGAATVSMYSTKRWDITTRAGKRTDPTQPEVRYVQDPDCEALEGLPGFSINVFRYFHPVGQTKVVRTEKFHTNYIARDTVRCGKPPKPKPTPTQP